MELLEIVLQVQKICDEHVACRRCPLNEFQDICTVLCADGAEDMRRFERFIKKVRKEEKVAIYRKEQHETTRKEMCDMREDIPAEESDPEVLRVRVSEDIESGEREETHGDPVREDQGAAPENGAVPYMRRDL